MSELEKTGNKRPFTVPENYFNNFAEQMEKQIAAESPAGKYRLHTRLSVAAAAIIAIVFVSQLFVTERKEERLSMDAFNTYYILSQVNENSMMDWYVADEEPETSRVAEFDDADHPLSK